MSLINDALKRASRAQQRGSPPPVPGVPLRPAEGARPRRSGLGWPSAVVLAVLLVIVLAMVWAGRRRGSEGTAAPLAKHQSIASPPSAATPSAAAWLPPPQKEADGPISSTGTGASTTKTAVSAVPPR